MKKPPPRTGSGGLVQRTGSTLLTGFVPQPAPPFQIPDPWNPLDGETLIEIRRIWWNHRRRYGSRLPAERGVILIEGWRR